MLAWTGGSKRRLRRQLRNQPVVEGVTVETQKAGASKRTESGKRKQEVPSQGAKALHMALNSSQIFIIAALFSHQSISCAASQRPTHNATKAKPTSGDVASLDLLLFKSPSQVVAGPSHQTPGTGSQGDVQATKRDSNTPEADQCFSFPSTPCTPRSLPDDSSPVCSASPPADNCGAFFEPSTEPNRAVQNSIAHRGTPERPTKYALCLHSDSHASASFQFTLPVVTILRPVVRLLPFTCAYGPPRTLSTQCGREFKRQSHVSWEVSVGLLVLHVYVFMQHTQRFACSGRRMCGQSDADKLSHCLRSTTAVAAVYTRL